MARVGADVTLERLLPQLAKTDAVAVTEGGAVVGVITPSAVISALAAHEKGGGDD